MPLWSKERVLRSCLSPRHAVAILSLVSAVSFASGLAGPSSGGPTPGLAAARFGAGRLAVAAGSAVGYYFIDDIMHYLTVPVGKLYYMQPAEAFFTYIKIAVVVGFLLALPVIFYHVWRFFLPALTREERLVLGIVVPVSVGLFFLGLAFSFFLVFPAAILFFKSFGSAELEAMFSVNRYFEFVIMFVLPFGFVFELPLIITILGKLGFISSAFLQKYARIVIFLSFVIAAVISPTPDVFTQSMIALPMILLYGVGYLIVRFILRK